MLPYYYVYYFIPHKSIIFNRIYISSLFFNDTDDFSDNIVFCDNDIWGLFEYSCKFIGGYMDEGRYWIVFLLIILFPICLLIGVGISFHDYFIPKVVDICRWLC